ncbi:c-type cytochrome [Maribacter polysaccharolyticus]|uniref:c-type cytochrome n=1 Tax=Maribacter polysaccharolyticus TaxID=3020831 RepID=UPI00237FC65A|nr:cytochrome c [Maribacter polysaccharolyticus]MDE3741082.1 cytochrome c [Maribacter polysaccharolyticus]
MKNIKFLPSTITITMCFLFIGFNTHAQDKWVAPANADKIINPLKGNTSATESGKRTFKMLCVVCHGAKGKGNGIGGSGLTPKPSDLTSTSVQNQTDGAIYWKLTKGRPPMASYETAIPENKRWEIINYIRTLKK